MQASMPASENWNKSLTGEVCELRTEVCELRQKLGSMERQLDSIARENQRVMRAYSTMNNTAFETRELIERLMCLQARGPRRSPQSWWNATLHSGKKHQASEGMCGAKPHDFFYFFFIFSCKNHLIQVKDSQ